MTERPWLVLFSTRRLRLLNWESPTVSFCLMMPFVRLGTPAEHSVGDWGKADRSCARVTVAAFRLVPGRSPLYGFVTLALYELASAVSRTGMVLRSCRGITLI